MLGDLGRIATHANNLREFAHAISQRPAAPSVLLALSDALLEEHEDRLSEAIRGAGLARIAQKRAAADLAAATRQNRQPDAAALRPAPLYEPSLEDANRFSASCRAASACALTDGYSTGVCMTLAHAGRARIAASHALTSGSFATRAAAASP